MHRQLTLRLAAVLLACCAPPLHAQQLAPGQIVPDLIARADPAQRYALYLPSGYDPRRRWPVLFLMDPRGRALEPLERARGAAERLGWVVLSSYNTASDTDASPNGAALGAILGEAERRVSVDERRMYLGGFSGTAREAWTFALRLEGGAAGVIGFGAGLPNDRVLPQVQGMGRAPFAFFGGAGTADFNHQEVRELDGRLDAAGVPHRLLFYPGEHAWPAAEGFTEALEWMELQAVRAGSSARGAGWVDSLLARRTGEARALEAAGRGAEARERWRAVADDFRGLRDVAPAEARVAELERAPAVRQLLAEQARLQARDSVHLRRLLAFVRNFAAAGRPASHGRLMDELEIAQLKREEGATADSLRAQSARRLLENVFVYTAFYGPRVFLAAGDTERALALLRLAGEIRPGNPQVCLGVARAQARAGRRAEALRALECMAASGRVSADVLAGDPLLEPLRAEPAFRALLSRLRATP